MMPGETRTVNINNDLSDLPSGIYTLVVGGFHQKEQRFTVKI